MQLLDPKIDVVFKLLFAHPSHRDIQISLLTAVLQPKVPIPEATVRASIADCAISRHI